MKKYLIAVACVFLVTGCAEFMAVVDVIDDVTGPELVHEGIVETSTCEGDICYIVFEDGHIYAIPRNDQKTVRVPMGGKARVVSTDGVLAIE